MKVTAVNRRLIAPILQNLNLVFALFSMFAKLSAAYKVDLAMRWLGYPARLVITYWLWSYLLEVNGANQIQKVSIIVYFVFALFLGHLYSFVRMAREIREEIYSGDIVIYMVRPLPHFLTCYSKAVMTVVLNAFLAFPVIWLIAFALTGFIPSVLQVFGFLISFVVGFTIMFLIHYVIALMTFFTGDILGVLRVFWVVSDFLGGMFLPLYLLPLAFQNILQYTPFQFWVYLPASILSGGLSVSSLGNQLAIGVGWVLFLIVVYQVLWTAGTRRYSGHSI